MLETTSHGLAQYRVDACEFDLGVVTNITHEHLDQHGSYENYQAAKARLFTSLEKTRSKPQGNPRLAVLNKDDRSYEYLSRLVSGPQCSYGLDSSADIWAENLEYSPHGLRFEAVGQDFRLPIASSLLGAFNVSNCLAAASAALRGLNIDSPAISQGIASMPGIPGRMEQVDLGQPFTAIVDFAHTPNALRIAIETVRKLTQKRVIVIFGSAGLRDREKRRMMAEVAAELADVSLLTAEDPRTESLDEILEEMARGAHNRGGVEEKTFFRVPDRGDAIRMGVRLAQTGDVVMACGKGHEQSMCFGTIEYPWDDRTAMRAALSELIGVDGPQMPYLPTKARMMPDANWTAPVTLDGKNVRLEPLTDTHVPGLAAVGLDDRIWRLMLYGQMHSEEDMRKWVHSLLEGRLAGTDLPFAVIHKPSGRVVGATRYLDIRPAHRGLEIGGTWYGLEFQRTVVNTECKYLLLKYAFEELNTIRVQFKADIRNERSWHAIERIGATREGILRNHYILPDGSWRDSVYYSIIDLEWPIVKRKLEEMMNR